MWKTSEEIKSQLTPTFQKLINDILAKSDGSSPLIFADEQKYQKIFSTPFQLDINACFWFDNKQFYIFLKQLDVVTIKEELDIAHELGHLWLFLCNFPHEKRTTNKDRQNAYDTFFGPSHDIMGHAIFYPYLKNRYKINLYKVGNNRLIEFIKNQLPSMKYISQGEKLLLMLNYIRYVIESDDQHWRGILHKAYSEKAPDNLKIIEESLLPIIHELEN